MELCLLNKAFVNPDSAWTVGAYDHGSVTDDDVCSVTTFDLLPTQGSTKANSLSYRCWNRHWRCLQFLGPNLCPQRCVLCHHVKAAAAFSAWSGASTVRTESIQERKGTKSALREAQQIDLWPLWGRIPKTVRMPKSWRRSCALQNQGAPFLWSVPNLISFTHR